MKDFFVFWRTLDLSSGRGKTIFPLFITNWSNTSGICTFIYLESATEVQQCGQMHLNVLVVEKKQFKDFCLLPEILVSPHQHLSSALIRMNTIKKAPIVKF